MIVNVPVALPGATGMKFTVTEQDAKIAKVDGQELLKANPAPETPTDRLLRTNVPELPIVSIFATVEFTGTFP
jgi:hypothetical protein